MNYVPERRNAAVLIDYTNHRGERTNRRILPIALRFGDSEWHPGARWLLEAMDLEKNAHRTFALEDIHAWRPVPGKEPS